MSDMFLNTRRPNYDAWWTRNERTNFDQEPVKEKDGAMGERGQNEQKMRIQDAFVSKASFLM